MGSGEGFRELMNWKKNTFPEAKQAKQRTAKQWRWKPRGNHKETRTRTHKEEWMQQKGMGFFPSAETQQKESERDTWTEGGEAAASGSGGRFKDRQCERPVERRWWKNRSAAPETKVANELVRWCERGVREGDQNKDLVKEERARTPEERADALWRDICLKRDKELDYSAESAHNVESHDGTFIILAWRWNIYFYYGCWGCVCVWNAAEMTHSCMDADISERITGSWLQVLIATLRVATAQ